MEARAAEDSEVAVGMAAEDWKNKENGQDDKKGNLKGEARACKGRLPIDARLTSEVEEAMAEAG